MKPQEKAAGTKERILTRILPLFLGNNYESITIGLIEDTTRMTRGTSSRRHYRYYDSPRNVLFAIPPEKYNLTEYWKLKLRQLECAYSYLREYGILVDMLAISHYIEIQCMRIIPTFRDLIASHEHRNLKYWSRILRNTPDIILNTHRMSYQRAGEIYQGLFLQLFSSYPNGKSNLPNISFT